ncbi:outer dense fiber protein 2-like [Hoplias malabaricus]|uniref:outer dense fiber protein 2-like n=1 Tax=Hoplias malabaricus TaxID=27720 RepID=UPI00346314C8
MSDQQMDESGCERLSGMRTMSCADLRESPLGCRTIRDELTSCGGDVTEASVSRSETRSHISQNHRFSDDRTSYEEQSGDQTALLKTLLEAESAASSAAAQLLTFRDSLQDDSARLRGFDRASESEAELRGASLRLWRQKGLLLEKLDMFKCLNSSVRRQLMEFLQQEMRRSEAEEHIKELLKRLDQTEQENQGLRLSLTERKGKVQELMALRKKEMENTQSMIQLSHSVDSTRAHLQLQLHNKETENSRLTEHLQVLERTVSQQKLDKENLRAQISSVSTAASDERDTLRKAWRSHRLRAEKFTNTMDTLHNKIREQEEKLAEVRAEGDRWRCEQEKVTEERVRLDAEITTMNEEISVLSAKLQRERQLVKTADDLLLEKVEKLNTEISELTLNNTTLRASVAELEETLQESDSALQLQSALSEERKRELEEHQSQVAKLQVEVMELRIRLESQFQENQELSEGREQEVTQLRQSLRARVKQLEVFPELLNSAEQKLQLSHMQLQCYNTTVTHKTEAITQLSTKLEELEQKLKSTLEMKESLKEVNSQLRHKLDSLQKKLEETERENQDLVSRLSIQEVTLQLSSGQLEQRSAECVALRRHLEGALNDVSQQVCMVKEKASSRENTLKSRILELEMEISRRENELKQLKLNKHSSEKHFEMRLKDLQVSLDQSESHKQGIQNYLDFLRKSYSAMFEDHLPSVYGSSHYLK